MKVSLFFTISLLFFTNVFAQQTREKQLVEIRSLFNYDESKVSDYILPDPLALTGDKKVKSIEEWEKLKRPETLNLFKKQVYGKIPDGLRMTAYRVIEESDETPYKNAIRRQVRMSLEKSGKILNVDLLIYLPKTEKDVPLFIGYNFFGNATVTNDKVVFLTDSWVRKRDAYNITNHRLTEGSRGAQSSMWPIQEILDNGYGLATMYYGDIDPDINSYIDFSDGVHPFSYKKGQTRPKPDEWGAISAWAWGLSRAMDYLDTSPGIDASKVIVMGHSRLGKTALWAGALDKRFAIVISNNSGCGGADLSRRNFAETVKYINTDNPHWFCNNFKKYNDNEDALPVDQHQLIALIAPRPVYIASAEEEIWADTRGEYLSGYYASPVYQLYGLTGLTSEQMPAVNHPVMNRIGYHIRSGKHDVTLYDWQQFIRFANKHFYNR